MDGFQKGDAGPEGGMGHFHRNTPGHDTEIRSLRNHGLLFSSRSGLMLHNPGWKTFLFLFKQRSMALIFSNYVQSFPDDSDDVIPRYGQRSYAQARGGLSRENLKRHI